MQYRPNHLIIALILFLSLPGALRAQEPDDTTARVTKFAREFAAAVTKGDTAGATAMIDINALMNRVTAGVNTSNDFTKGFTKGFRTGASSQLLASIVRTVGDGGSYRLLRVRQRHGQTSALFRLIQKDGALTYHEFIAARDAQGGIKFDDMYAAATGEMLGQTLRRLYVAGAVQQNPSLLSRLFGADRQYAANTEKIAEMSGQFGEGKFRETLATYRGLPRDMQENKSLLLMRLAAAQKLMDQSPGEYESAVADLRRLFPTDPCLDLLTIDSLLNNGKYDQARQGIDRIEAYTAGDSYLDFLRGNIDLMQGGPDQLVAAKIAFDKSIATEPTLIQPYWGLVTLSLRNHDFDETAAQLDRIQQKFHLKIGNLTTVPLYADFVKSEAYKTWKARQAQ